MSIPIFTRREKSPQLRRHQLRNAANTSWEPKQLKANHLEMIRLSAKGMRVHDIARAMGHIPRVVQQVLNGELAREELAKMLPERDAEAADVAEQLAEASKRAVEVLSEMVDDDELSAGIRLKASTEVLDRAGYGKVTKVEQHNSHTYYAKLGLEGLKERAREVSAVPVNILTHESRVDSELEKQVTPLTDALFEDIE